MQQRLQRSSFMVLCAGILLVAGSAKSANEEPQLVSHGIAHDMLYGLSMEGRSGEKLQGQQKVVLVGSGGAILTVQR